MAIFDGYACLTAPHLRTGRTKSQKYKTPVLSLVKVGDLLVTSGLDGLFPERLEAATVTKINPLKEGDYYFELEAMPTAGDMNEYPMFSFYPRWVSIFSTSPLPSIKYTFFWISSFVILHVGICTMSKEQLRSFRITCCQMKRC